MGKYPTARNTFTAMALATWVAGVLDIAFAMAGALIAKKTIPGLLQGIAKGPFRDDPQLTTGVAGAFVGLGVHFFLMLIIAMVFVRAARGVSYLTQHPWISGAVYGVAVYLVMYWIVLPQRWPDAFPQTGVGDIAKAVFAHVVCVGLPIALITAQLIRPPVRTARAT